MPDDVGYMQTFEDEAMTSPETERMRSAQPRQPDPRYVIIGLQQMLSARDNEVLALRIRIAELEAKYENVTEKENI